MRIREIITIAALLLGLATGLPACGKRHGAESAVPLPEDSFPSHARAIEPGLTLQSEILTAFGEPDSFQKRWDGTAIWHYRHSEILTATSIAPEVAARESTRAEAVALANKEKRRTFAEWWRRTFYFPPRRPSAQLERVPAVIHQLTVSFKPDGTVVDFDYRQEVGSLRVPK